MFDIKEYFQHHDSQLIAPATDMDAELASDVDEVLSTRFSNLYQTDRYKLQNLTLDIVSPVLSYPGNKSLILTPDRVRFLLSFFPDKVELEKIDKIVVRPRFIEVGGIELVSLYLRKRKIIVMYLSHPHAYDGNGLYEASEDTLAQLTSDRTIDRTINKNTRDHSDPDEIRVHPLWHIIKMVSPLEDTFDGEQVEKFFMKLDSTRDKMYEDLTNISFFYKRNGY